MIENIKLTHQYITAQTKTQKCQETTTNPLGSMRAKTTATKQMTRVSTNPPHLDHMGPEP